MPGLKLQRILVSVVGLALLGGLALIVTMAFELWMAPDLLLMLESLQWGGLGLWTIALLSAITLLVLLWLTMAFSLLALICALCVGAALTMILSGFSLVWPLLLLLLAAWGVGRVSQLD
jgi:hypothetical protein